MNVLMKLTCNRCKSQVNENKEIEGNLNLLKRQAPNQFGYMLPYFGERWFICNSLLNIYSSFLLFSLCMLATFPNSLGFYFSNLCLNNTEHDEHLALTLVLTNLFWQSIQGMVIYFT